MSLYLIVWICLCLLALYEMLAGRTRLARVAFWCSFAGLAAMLMLRYGQGTDFFAYQYYYYQMSDTVLHVPVEDVHGELGYQFLTNVFRLLHLPYEALVAFLGAVQMGGLLAFLRRYRVDCVLALALAVPTLYLTYFMSGVRQGAVIALFLGVLFPLLEKKRYPAYLAGTVLCILLHSSAVLFLVLPLVQRFRRTTTVQALTALAWVGGALLASPPVQAVVTALPVWTLRYYLRATSVSLLATGERLFFLLLVTGLYLWLERRGKTTPALTLAYRCYLVAMAVYGALLCNGTTASRMASMLRYVEIFLLIYALGQMPQLGRRLMTVALLLFQTMMFAKNIQAAIDQGDYMVDLTVMNYPYVSVFNEQDIFELRRLTDDYRYIPQRQEMFARSESSAAER